MKRLCASNRSKHFSTIKSINKDSESAFLKSTLNNNEESFINCLQEPSIFSHYSNEEEKN